MIVLKQGLLAVLFQRGSAILRDLEPLRLDRLLGLQGQQLVHGLHRLQRTLGRLALAHEVGQHAFVFVVM